MSLYFTYTLSAYVFQLNDGPEGADPLGLWLTVTDAMLAPFCGSDDNTLMFMAQPKDKFATTKDLDLSTNDVLQFRVGFYTHACVL